MFSKCSVCGFRRNNPAHSDKCSKEAQRRRHEPAGIKKPVIISPYRLVFKPSGYILRREFV